jgi:hypothetical protein
MRELDVERLAHAYNNVVVAGGHGEFVSMRHWSAVVAEYARLAESRPSDGLREAGEAAVAWWRAASQDGPREAELYGALAAAIERVEAAR